jgi:proteasome lid subunit RPN8/RPN11
MVQALRIPLPFYEEMIAHLFSVYPLEGCGLLAGSSGRIERHYPIENRLTSPVAFEMDPRQLVEAMLDMERNGVELEALYHSHPSGPNRPSAVDIAQSYYPEAAHIIVSLRDLAHPAARAYWIRHGEVGELQMVVG